MARREYGYRRDVAGSGTRFAAGPVEMEPKLVQPDGEEAVVGDNEEESVTESVVAVESQDAASLADFAPHLVQEPKVPVVEDEPEPGPEPKQEEVVEEAPAVEDEPEPEPEPEQVQEEVVESKDETSELDPVASEDIEDTEDTDDDSADDDTVEEAESETSWQ